MLSWSSFSWMFFVSNELSYGVVGTCSLLHAVTQVKAHTQYPYIQAVFTALMYECIFRHLYIWPVHIRPVCTGVFFDTRMNGPSLWVVCISLKDDMQ